MDSDRRSARSRIEEDCADATGAAGGGTFAGAAGAQGDLRDSVEAVLRDVDPARRDIGLSLDRNGRFRYQGVEITHERLHQALMRWLTWDPEARRFRVQVSPVQWAWVDVQDAPYQAHIEAVEPDALRFRLSDGREFRYEGDSIAVGPDDAWYVPVGPPPLWARLDRAALGELADLLEEAQAGDAVAAESDAAVHLRLPAGRILRFVPYLREG